MTQKSLLSSINSLQNPPVTKFPSTGSCSPFSSPGYASDVLQVRYPIVDLETGKLIAVLPYREEFTGNFSTPCLHGGVLGSLLDHCGHDLTQFFATERRKKPSVTGESEEEDVSIQRLNFRVDYLLPAPCFEEIICEYQITHHSTHLIRMDGVCWNFNRRKKLAIGRMSYSIE